MTIVFLKDRQCYESLGQEEINALSIMHMCQLEWIQLEPSYHYR